MNRKNEIKEMENTIRTLTTEFIIPSVHEKMHKFLHPLRMEAGEIFEKIKQEKEEFKKLLRQSELIRFNVDLGNGTKLTITANHLNKDEVLDWVNQKLKTNIEYKGEQAQ